MNRMAGILFLEVMLTELFKHENGKNLNRRN